MMGPRDIEKRQWELWGIALTVILCFAATIIYLAIFSAYRSVFLIFLGVFSLLLCLYIVEREKKLMIITQWLREEELQVLEESGQGIPVGCPPEGTQCAA